MTITTHCSKYAVYAALCSAATNEHVLAVSGDARGGRPWAVRAVAKGAQVAWRAGDDEAVSAVLVTPTAAPAPAAKKGRVRSCAALHAS